MLADLNGDGFLDIVAVTNNGHVVAIKHNGSLLWDTDIAPYFGMAPGEHEIHSSPAVDDIDGDGFPEVALGTGSISGSICTQGGLIVLGHTGRVEPGWPYLSYDDGTPPVGCRDTVFATPALGDLDNDGDLEIVAAGFDKRIYAWHHDGTLLPGFPPSSSLRERFPGWQDLIGKLADNTWSSPALGDLDGDGFLDIIIGSGEGNFDARWGGDSGGWTCPYALPPGWAPGYCGGSIYAFNRFGQVLPGFPRYVLEAIGSSPAAKDVNGDGRVEIFIGTSDFYYSTSPDHPTFGFRLYGLDQTGQDLPGWGGGKVVGGSTMASPIVGDIAGDSRPEIIIAAMDHKLYAWHQNGQPVAGFPMAPKDQYGNAVGGFGVGTSGILADYDGDSKMEILLVNGWIVVVVDGNGQQLTSTNFPSDPRPLYFTDGMLQNTPAVGDLDHDGKLELVASNSKVYVWDLNSSSNEADWPMWRQNPRRTGQELRPVPWLSASELFALALQGSRSTELQFKVANSGAGELGYSIAADSNRVSVSPVLGTVSSTEQEFTVIIDTRGLAPAAYDLGSVILTMTDSGGIPLPESPYEIPLTVVVTETIYQLFFPTTIR